MRDEVVWLGDDVSKGCVCSGFGFDEGDVIIDLLMGLGGGARNSLSE